MFNLNETNKYNTSTQGVDMRKGVESLCGIVRTIHMNSLNGNVYVFSNKSRCLLKMLHWERGGFVVYYKRFEQGRLSNTVFKQKESAFVSLRWDAYKRKNHTEIVYVGLQRKRMDFPCESFVKCV